MQKIARQWSSQSILENLVEFDSFCSLLFFLNGVLHLIVIVKQLLDLDGPDLQKYSSSAAILQSLK